MGCGSYWVRSHVLNHSKKDSLSTQLTVNSCYFAGALKYGSAILFQEELRKALNQIMTWTSSDAEIQSIHIFEECEKIHEDDKKYAGSPKPLGIKLNYCGMS